MDYFTYQLYIGYGWHIWLLDTKNGDIWRIQNISLLKYQYFQTQFEWPYIWLRILGLNARRRKYSEKMNSKNIHATTIRHFLFTLLSGHLRSSWISNHSLCLKFKRTQYWPFSLLPKGNVFLEFFFVKFRASKVYWKMYQMIKFRNTAICISH